MKFSTDYQVELAPKRRRYRTPDEYSDLLASGRDETNITEQLLEVEDRIRNIVERGNTRQIKRMDEYYGNLVFLVGLVVVVFGALIYDLLA